MQIENHALQLATARFSTRHSSQISRLIGSGLYPRPHFTSTRACQQVNVKELRSCAIRVHTYAVFTAERTPWLLILRI